MDQSWTHAGFRRIREREGEEPAERVGYETFAPVEARRLVQKLEIVPTPKHGSWLNMAEIELSAMEKQCLREHTPDESALRRQVETWERERNQRRMVINWRFTTADARIKLHRLYPQIKA